MTEIVVRYEPENKWWRVYVDGKQHYWPHTFLGVRTRAKALNGGKLPRLASLEYGEMFPDRIHVCRSDGEFLVFQGREWVWCPKGFPAQAAAMSAAHELAKGVGV